VGGVTKRDLKTSSNNHGRKWKENVDELRSKRRGSRSRSRTRVLSEDGRPNRQKDNGKKTEGNTGPGGTIRGERGVLPDIGIVGEELY